MPFGAESGNEQWRRKATLCCSGSLYPSLHPSQSELAKEKKSVRFGRKEWNRAASHGAACGYDCGDGHRGRSHLPASVGLPPVLLTWLSFPPPWWPVMAHTLHHHHARLQPALPLVSLVNSALFSHSLTRMCSTPQIPSQGSACPPATASTRKLVTLSRII